MFRDYFFLKYYINTTNFVDQFATVYEEFGSQ